MDKMRDGSLAVVRAERLRETSSDLDVIHLQSRTLIRAQRRAEDFEGSSTRLIINIHPVRKLNI